MHRDHGNLYEDGIHLTVAHKREWSYGFKPDNKTVPLPCYLEPLYDHQRESTRRKPSLLELDKLPGCKGAHPNRVAPEIEQAILDYSLTRPTHGPLRVA